MIWSVWKNDCLATEWRSLMDNIVAKNPDFEGTGKYTIAKKITLINTELEPYRGTFNFQTAEVEFETEQDYMFFKLRYS